MSTSQRLRSCDVGLATTSAPSTCFPIVSGSATARYVPRTPFGSGVPTCRFSVVGVPDDRYGERAAAVVRVRDGATVPTLPELQAHLAETGLAKQKWPEFVYEVAEFPRTPSGKVQKFKVRQDLREMEQHRA